NRTRGNRGSGFGRGTQEGGFEGTNSAPAGAFPGNGACCGSGRIIPMRLRLAHPFVVTAVVLGVLPCFLLCQTQSPAVELASFGARPNDASLNSRDALQKALASLAAKGGGRLHIAAGQYYIDFPDIASDVDPKDPATEAVRRQKTLSRGKLIIVPSK